MLTQIDEGISSSPSLLRGANLFLKQETQQEEYLPKVWATVYSVTWKQNELSREGDVGGERKGNKKNVR